MPYNNFINENLSTVEGYSATYVDFTSSLITSTFEALLDTTLKQVEAYTDMVGTMSKDLSSYINETTDEIHDEEVLEYLEMLPLEQAGLINEGNSVGLEYVTTNNNEEQRRLIEVDPTGKKLNTGSLLDMANVGKALVGKFSPTSVLAKKAVDTIASAVKLPSSTGTDFKTLDDLETEAKKTNAKTTDLNKYIFTAIAQRIASNKYALLENMVKLGLLRLVYNNGVLETSMGLSFTQVDKYSKVEIDKVKDRTKNKRKVKRKSGLASYLFGNRNKSRDITKHTHFEVHKTKEKESTTNRGSANLNAHVRIEFSTDYQPLS